MKRDLVFRDGDSVSSLLGVDQDRVAAIDAMVNSMLKAGMTAIQIVSAVNETVDTTDSEWTFLVFSLGGYFGARKQQRHSRCIILDAAEREGITP